MSMQITLSSRMCHALKKRRALELYDLSKLLDHAYQELYEPQAIARLLLALEPYVLEDLLFEDELELVEALGERMLDAVKPHGVGAIQMYDPPGDDSTPYSPTPEPEPAPDKGPPLSDDGWANYLFDTADDIDKATKAGEQAAQKQAAVTKRATPQASTHTQANTTPKTTAKKSNAWLWGLGAMFVGAVVLEAADGKKKRRRDRDEDDE